MEAGTPTAPELRPLGLGEILDVSIKVYLRHAVELFKPVAAVFVPLQVLVVLLIILALPSFLLGTGQPPPADPFADTTPAEIAAFAVGALLAGAVSLVAQVLATAAAFKGVADAYLGAQPEWRNSLAFVTRRLRSLVWISILAGLVTFLGFLALIVPGIYLAVAFQLVTPVLLAEDVRGGAALGRSLRLVRGRWWHTFAVIFLGFMLALVVSLVIGAVIGVPAGLLAVASPVGSAVLNQVGGVISTVLVLPFQAAIIAVVYFDLRVRKEGFDLELLARQVGTTPGQEIGMGVPMRPAPGMVPGGPAPYPPAGAGPMPPGGPLAPGAPPPGDDRPRE